MTPFRMLALVLIALLVVAAATPARAEAMETTTILLIATAGVAIVIVIVYLIVANMNARKHAGVPVDGTPEGTPIGGTRTDGASSSPTAVAVTSYVVTSPALDPATAAAAVQGQ